MRHITLTFLVGCVLLVVSPSPLAAGEEPVRLPVPLDLHEGSRTDYYGIYAQGSKVGWGSITLGRVELDGVPVLASIDEMRVRVTGLGRTQETHMASRRYYDLHPPYPLLHGWHEVRKGDDLQRVEVRRDVGTYTAVIAQAGGRRTMDLGRLDSTFADLTTLIAWFRSPRKEADRLAVRSFDLSDLEPDVETYGVQSVRRVMADGVAVTWYEAAGHSARDGDQGVVRMDSRGRMLSARVGGAIEIRLEPKTVAQKPGVEVDLFVNRMAKIDAPLGDPREITEMVVRVRGPGAESVRSGPWQTATYSEDTRTLTLTIGKEHGTQTSATGAEIRRALEETPDYPIRDPKVVALAEAAVGDTEDPELRVVRLVSFVDAFVRDDYHAEPLTVLDLIQVRKGDCSEHAALFTTLARALGIPAREVSGIAYMGDEVRAFGGHAWNEVLIGDRWVPVDPTWGEHEIDATHIRQATEGTGAAAYLALGGAEIELVSAAKRSGR